MKKYTHITKKGFGGLLKAGIYCTIYYSKGCSVSVILEDGSIWAGNINDLNPIN
jgi:hypothetical protein